MNQIAFNSAIDIKSIAECNVCEIQNNRIILGSAVTLTKICEANVLPLLSEAAKMAADHTSRNRISLGGNICSSLPYKETVLPLLTCDASVVIMGSNGKRTAMLSEVFNQNIILQSGEFLVQFIIDTLYAKLPFRSVKRTRQGELDYPLASVAAIKKDGRIRFSFSGICSFPFRSLQIENGLNLPVLSQEDRINKAISHLPAAAVTDILGSAEYRHFVLANILKDMLGTLEGVV